MKRKLKTPKNKDFLCLEIINFKVYCYLNQGEFR